ncbi:acetolactate synthase small subunit [Chryseobacterium sp.]|uniref:acetolactate synthase small subunit n=1 Tax=Chryseobacterium sp. TaxID=1871047 RepID=UPI0025C0E4AB|nr:acetolactate synthase small subunit [Chryseobacterium sp.]
MKSESDKKEYTIITYTEDYLGVINRISTMFSRRRIDIKSLHVEPSEISSVKKFTIVIKETEEAIRKLAGQIEKQVDVLEVHYQKTHCMTIVGNAANY